MALRSAAVAVLATAIGLALAASCRPSWYRPRSPDFSSLASDKAEIAALENRISAALNARQSVEIALTAEQLNRWLAGATEMGAGLLPEWPIERPMVRFVDAGFESAGVVRIGGMPLIVTLSGRPRLEHDVLALEELRVAIGALRVPAGWILRRIHPTEATGAAPSAGPSAWVNRWVWPNGRRGFRVASMEISPDGCRVRLDPVDASLGGASLDAVRRAAGRPE